MVEAFSFDPTISTLGTPLKNGIIEKQLSIWLSNCNLHGSKLLFNKLCKVLNQVWELGSVPQHLSDNSSVKSYITVTYLLVAIGHGSAPQTYSAAADGGAVSVTAVQR